MERVIGGIVHSLFASAFSFPRVTTHLKSSRRQLVQGIPSWATLQRTFLARQYWHAFETILLVERRAPCNSAAEISLLVVDCRVQGMAAVLVPLCSTMKQYLLVCRPHVQSQAHESKYYFETTKKEIPGTWKQVGRVIKPLVSRKQI